MWRVVMVAMCMACPAWADAPETSIFPRARPAIVTDAVQAAVAAATAPLALVAQPATSPRPRARPAALATTAPVTAVSSASEAPAPRVRRGLMASLFGAPRARPDPADDAPQTAIPQGNSVCGDPAIIGRTLPAISSGTRGCGIDTPVEITAIDGIALSQPSTLDCGTATALRQWIDAGLRPAFADTRVVGLQIAGHYVCRSRNNVRGAPVSEHGRGKAIDISGIVLANGRSLTVQGNWNSAMRAAYKAGCGIFGTTLGPGSDGYHEDHMHFDTANHRNGAYCR